MNASTSTSQHPLPVSAWIAIALSFIIVFVLVSFLGVVAYNQFIYDAAQPEQSVVMANYAIFAGSALLSALNAILFYKRAKAKQQHAQPTA